MKPEYSVIPSYFCIPKGMLPARLSEVMSSTHICSKHLPLGSYKCISYNTTPQIRGPTAHNVFKRSLLSAVTVQQGPCECVFNIFKYLLMFLFIYLPHFLCVSSKLIKQWHLQLFPPPPPNPPISPKETASQHLAMAQNPPAPVDVQPDQHFPQVACCPGDTEGYEGGFERPSWPWFLTLHASLTVWEDSWFVSVRCMVLTYIWVVFCLWAVPAHTFNKFYFRLKKRGKQGAMILHVLPMGKCLLWMVKESTHLQISARRPTRIQIWPIFIS